MISPSPQKQQLASGLAADLAAAVGTASVLTQPAELLTYELDAGMDMAVPDAVVLPSTAAQVCAVFQVARKWRLPVVPRGAGTGISGGAIAEHGGIVIGTSRMDRILSIDPNNMRATVQPGVRNTALSEAAAPHGLFYAPDPSSQRSSTIGGNVAENAGGPHCLAHGVTTNYILGLELVTPDGEIIWCGPADSGYDLAGVVCGSEGMFGMVTAVTLRLKRLPEATTTMLVVFPSMEGSGEAVSAIIAHGILPTALELLDHEAITAIEPFAHAGYPTDAAAALLVEIDGLRDGLIELAERIRAICLQHGATLVRLAQDDDERARLWKGRKSIAGALGRLAPAYYVVDGVVPRSKLPQALMSVQATANEYGLRVANVAHAGDGNLHPTILYDPRNGEERRRVLQAGSAMLKACLALGGALSGEHGIGLEKRHLMRRMFTEADLDIMARLKTCFDPEGLMNPGKMFPVDSQTARQ
jgi:glycolate oxidase